MSGNGNGPDSSTSTDCKSLNIRTQIASPDPKVIATLSVGDLLKIVVKPPRGPATFVTKKGETAGALLPGDLHQLIDCINDGYEYVGKVVSIKGANCQVLIKAK